jgi:outer membrane protein assembly factor BamB
VYEPGEKLARPVEKGAAVFAVTRASGRLHAETVWETNRMKTTQSTALLHEGYLYGLDGRILACLDAATGELQWKGGRYGYGQLLLASGHLVVLTESGDVALVVEATPNEHREVARFPAIEGKSWTPATIAAGRLLVRNALEMAAFDISR